MFVITENIMKRAVFCKELSYIFQLYIGKVQLEDEKYVGG
jgi:hypothetical protein